MDEQQTVTCTTCGALVGDERVHENWHRSGLDQAVERATESSTRLKNLASGY